MLGSESSLVLGEPTELETDFGTLVVRHIQDMEREGVLVAGNSPPGDVIPVRLQSSCLFSESFNSRECDCALQLRASLKIIQAEGGYLIYLYDEGRGAGLKSKLSGIRIQRETGCDTATAFREMGLEPDMRGFRTSVEVIKQVLGTTTPIDLITNNPAKETALRQAGVNIASRRPIICSDSAKVASYLAEKARVLGHLINNE